MNTPRSFYLTAINPDYSLGVQDIALEARLRFRINSEIDANGKRVFTGWHKSAGTKVTFYVANAANEESARATVRDAVHKMSQTTMLAIELNSSGEEYLMPLITSVPLGAELMSLKPVSRKRSRDVSYLGDYIANVKDAWAARVSEARALVAA
jgi:hypothetical protein